MFLKKPKTMPNGLPVVLTIAIYLSKEPKILQKTIKATEIIEEILKLEQLIGKVEEPVPCEITLNGAFVDLEDFLENI